MNQKPSIPYNPHILVWAREYFRYSLEEAAEKAGISGIKGTKKQPAQTPAQRLKDWEQGIATPTISQLEILAHKAYRMPVLVFFLENPPQDKEHFEDYRTVGDSIYAKETPEFAAFKRKIIILQEMLRDIHTKLNDRKKSFVNSFSQIGQPKRLVNIIRNIIDLPFESQRAIKSPSALFTTIRELISGIGIYTIVDGDLGSYHSAIDPETFRGMSICDEYAPLIVINSNDKFAQAKLFTLIHEVSHIFLGVTSISNVNPFGNRTNLRDIERFCNAVAAEFLAPAERLYSSWKRLGLEGIAAIKLLANEYKLSLMAMARRLNDEKLLGDDDYWAFFQYRKQQYLESQKKVKEKAKETQRKYSKNLSYCFGESTILTLAKAYNSNLLTYKELALALQARLDKVQQYVMINK